MIKTFKKTIGIGVLITASIGANYYVVPSVHLYDHEYTLSQYDEMKPSFIEIIENRDSKLPTFEEAEMWKSIAKRELNKCGGWDFQSVTSENIVDQMNEKLRLGIC